MVPSAAIRVAFFWAEANPFFRRMTIACSMSALDSTSAFLQSIIPAPVFSRSSFTCFALISMTVPFHSIRQKNSHKKAQKHKKAFCEFVPFCGFDLLHHCGFVWRFYRFLAAGDVRTFRFRRAIEGSDDVTFGSRSGASRGGFLVHRLTFDDRLGNFGSEQADGAQSVIIAGDDIID